MLALVVKRTKRSVSLLCTNCLVQLKMNPFTSLCLLCTFGKEKKHNSWGAGAKASTSLSRATFFQLFKTSHAKRPGSQLWQDAGEREKTERGDKTKHKNSNICSRFQPDSLMWITQHSVPWPWRTKGGGGMPQEWSATPWEASVQWAPLLVSLSWTYCPSAGQRGATGAPRHCMPLGLS